MKDRGYSSKDGIKLLDLLGLTRIADEERIFFRKSWSKHYDKSASPSYKALINATWEIYAEAIPYAMLKNDFQARAVATYRNADFSRRLEMTKVEDEFGQGMTLDEIYEKGRFVFSHTINLGTGKERFEFVRVTSDMKN